MSPEEKTNILIVDDRPEKLGKKAILRIIHNALEKFRLKKEVALAHKKMAQMTTKDELTRLYNRRYFNDALTQEISRANRYEIDFSLCIMDLDHFKKINDSLGHAAGDKVLKKIAGLIMSKFRKNDIICRFGGKKFAIIFPHTSIKETIKVCDTFRKSLAETPLYFDSVPIRITVSIGISYYELKNSTRFEEIIKQADHALYAAKTAGRDQLKVYGQPPHDAGEETA